MTKATMLVSVGLAAGFAMADGISIVDARKQVADSVSNPSTMTAVVKQLPAADQCAYFDDVVAAVAKLPGSKEEAAAVYVNVSRAALKGASKGNVANMIAEIFATVPPEYLPAVSESLSSDMVNRATDASKTYTDAEYLEIVKATMETVNSRVASADASDVRSAFAALTFIRGSNKTSGEVVSAITAMLPASARKQAAEEWFPAALASGDDRNYDAMLVAASADDIPPEVLTKILHQIQIPGSQMSVAILADLNGANVDPTTKSNEKTPITDMAISVTDDIWNGGVLGPSGVDSDTMIEATIERSKDLNRIDIVRPGRHNDGGYQGQNTGY